MGFTAQFGGTGNPFTWNSFLKTFYSHSGTSTVNPAKRLSEFDFIYRLPGLRDWVQVYVDSMVIDEYSPIGSTRPAINPGIYFPQLPKIYNVEMRMEGVTDDLNVPAHFGPGAFYTDVRYRSGYTNNGNLIGSWVGRQGAGEQAWLTYRLSPRKSVQLFIATTGSIKFFSKEASFGIWGCGRTSVSRDFGFSAMIQQEHWHFPLLFPAAQSNIIASFQLTFLPGRNHDGETEAAALSEASFTHKRHDSGW